jgi:hypothetical protein
VVDTVEVRYQLIAMTAALAGDGRSVPVWSTKVRHYKVKATEIRRFLDELSHVLPPKCRPILITDAGFETPWIREVERRGWDCVCRLRGKAKVLTRRSRNQRGAMAAPVAPPGAVSCWRFAVSEQPPLLSANA